MNSTSNAPFNDAFASAAPLATTSSVVRASNTGASMESGEPSHAQASAVAGSVWWTWTAPASATVTIDLAGSSFDTVLSVYSGTAVNALSEVAGNDDAPGQTTSRVTFSAVQGTSYRIAVAGKGQTGLILLRVSTPPPFDLFSNPATLTGDPATLTTSNVGAGKESGEPNHAGNAGGTSVWFQWTAPASRSYRISTAGSSIDTLLGVYTGSAVGALSAIATNDNESGSLVTSALTFNAIAGTVYRIAVDGKNAASGSVRVVVSTPPSNDAFASRLPLVGTRAIATGTNIGATKEPGEPLHAGNSGGKSVWWTWMAAGVGPVEIHTNGSDFDTTLGVYTGGSVSGLTLVAGDDDSGDDVASRVVFTPSPGTVYQIAVDGFSGDDGAIQLSVVQSVLNSPPSVTDAVVTPAPLAWSDQEVQVTSVSSFDPEGDAVTLAYQWQFSADGTVFADASGATSARLPAVSSNLGKRWRCRITPSDGVSNGLPFVTQPVDIDRRPIQIGKVGLPYFYDSDLFVPGSFESFPRSAIINEFSQGPSGGSAEWIEILFLRSSDARGWTLRDMNSANSVTFNATSSVWQSIPAGTLLVIYNGGSKDPVLPLDDADASDGVLVLSSSSAPHFSGSWPILSNSNADGFAVRDLGGSLVDGVSINGQTSFQPALGTVSGARSARFNGDTEPSVELATAWTITSSANGSVSPGRGNAVSNSQFVTRLRQGDFDTPAVFALAQDSDTVPGLTINATTGVLSGVPSAPGLYQIGITRQRASASASSSFGLLIGSPEAAFIIPNGETLQLIGPASIPGSLRVDGTLSTQGFGLTISQTFESWLALHGNPGDDGDGLPLFLEYAFDLYPSAPDENGHSTLRVEGDTARFSFRRQMAPSDLQYVIESSSNLADWGPANVSGWTLLPAEPLGIDTERVTYEFPFDVAQPLFLRIRVLR